MAKRKKNVVDEKIGATIVDTPTKEEKVVEPVKEETPVEAPVVKTPVKEEVKPTVKTPTKPKPVVLDVEAYIIANKEKAKHACSMFNNFLEAEKIHSQSGNKTAMTSNRFSLYTELISIVNNVDYNTFKNNMDVISGILARDDNRLSEVKLMSYDYLWTFGSTSKLAYQILIKVISELSNPKYRSEKLKAISVAAVFKYLNQTGVSNLSRYYDL